MEHRPDKNSRLAKGILYCALASLLAACREIENIFPKTSFDAPMPGRNLELAGFLGHKIVLKTAEDTVPLNIFSNKKENIIVNAESGDTLFNGTIVSYQGLYYFNQPVNDSSFWIYAAYVHGNRIRGLGRGWEEILRVQQHIEKGEYPVLVKYISKDKTQIRLHPEKRAMSSLFSVVLSELQDDSLVFPWRFQGSPDTLQIKENLENVAGERL